MFKHMEKEHVKELKNRANCPKCGSLMVERTSKNGKNSWDIQNILNATERLPYLSKNNYLPAPEGGNFPYQINRAYNEKCLASNLFYLSLFFVVITKQFLLERKSFLKEKKMENKYKVAVIVPEEYPVNPREDSNLGYMACSVAAGGSIGDSDWKIDEKYASFNETLFYTVRKRRPDIFESIRECDGSDNVVSDQCLSAFFKWMVENAVVIPLYLYDHGGLEIIPYSPLLHDTWDISFCGFIVAFKEDAMQYFNWNEENIPEDWKREVEKTLLGEIGIYNLYLRGDVWCVKLYDSLPNMERYIDDGVQEDDIVCGYYGKETAEEAASEMAYVVLGDVGDREILKALKTVECSKEDKT